TNITNMKNMTNITNMKNMTNITNMKNMTNDINYSSSSLLIITNYDYFINYVKYNYCLLFINYYIKQNDLIDNIKHFYNASAMFYTPFNTYLFIQFLVNYKYYLYKKKKETIKLSEQDEIKYLLNKTKNQKITTFNNLLIYITNQKKYLNVHDTINIIKIFKFLSFNLHYQNMYLLHSLIFKFYKYLKINTSSELLIEYIKFLYFLELQNRCLFKKCKNLIHTFSILIFRTICKNIINNSENNYIGMSQFALLYIYHFIQKENNIFNYLPLEDIQKSFYLLKLNCMSLDKYYQSGISQLQISNVLINILKDKERVVNEYNVVGTPYTVDILVR
ncbi:conserved protein, unknown function, partial [Hepatocystis sp. ex Piliocolobus tephrosceles]